jgi:hypothetical protein
VQQRDSPINVFVGSDECHIRQPVTLLLVAQADGVRVGGRGAAQPDVDGRHDQYAEGRALCNVSHAT